MDWHTKTSSLAKVDASYQGIQCTVITKDILPKRQKESLEKQPKQCLMKLVSANGEWMYPVFLHVANSSLSFVFVTCGNVDTAEGQPLNVVVGKGDVIPGKHSKLSCASSGCQLPSCNSFLFSQCFLDTTTTSSPTLSPTLRMGFGHFGRIGR